MILILTRVCLCLCLCVRCTYTMHESTFLTIDILLCIRRHTRHLFKFHLSKMIAKPKTITKERSVFKK